MIKFFLVICIIFSLFNCKNEKDKSIVISREQESISTNAIESEIPHEIKTYLDSNNDFEILTEKDLKLINEQVKNTSILTYLKGDFNQNKIDDFAIILRYKKYKNDIYTNYNFPFLVIFNDYKNGVVPNIVYKSGDYAKEDIKTVIYDQFDEGIFSYLRKGKVCDRKVIDIVIPEKSSFFVFWNSNKLSYEFLNYLDEDLCQKLSINQNSSKGNLTLSENFSFKFLTSKSENESIKKEIKILLTNEKTNKIQEIDFIPEALLGSFNESPSNYSYFSDEKQIIETSEGIEVYHKLIVLDVNFDGLEDFAIINYEGGNGGPQYAYYIQKPNKEFVLDTYLTENIRYFPIEINKQEKTLTIGHPSGYCKIRTYKIQIQSNGEWKEVYSKLEDIK
ncbi:XAC2610-related protein [Flavobacterium sp.]|uniref:XAC2610-related protein n=1 Tax=Flavobacterium sp. TaxID=239 RepID=UPI00286E3944|nr:hypothetical protein [Flavobacterium sp.]